jgi:hypothetical protein
MRQVPSGHWVSEYKELIEVSSDLFGILNCDFAAMRLTVSLFAWISSLIVSEVVSSPASGYCAVARDSGHCNVSRAYSLLQQAHAGKAFCSTLLYPLGPIQRTKTITTTVKETDPADFCKLITKVHTSHEKGVLTTTFVLVHFLLYQSAYVL